MALLINPTARIVNPAPCKAAQRAPAQASKPAKLRMLAVGRVWEGEIVIASACDAEPENGTLQRLIQEGEATAEYEDWLEDVEFNRLGC